MLKTEIQGIADNSGPLSSEDPSRQLSKFESATIEVFVDMVQTLGLPKSFGEIYGLLYATADPLGFAEIHEKLTLSKGSVSGGIKALKELGAIKSSDRAGERREVFEPETELRQLVLAYLRDRIHPQLSANAMRMNRLDDLMKAHVPQASHRAVLGARLGKLSKWRKKASGLIPWVSRFLG